MRVFSQFEPVARIGRRWSDYVLIDSSMTATQDYAFGNADAIPISGTFLGAKNDPDEPLRSSPGSKT